MSSDIGACFKVKKITAIYPRIITRLRENSKHCTTPKTVLCCVWLYLSAFAPLQLGRRTMAHSTLLMPDTTLPGDLMKALGQGVGGTSLFDFTLATEWNPEPSKTIFEHGNQVTLMFDGINGPHNTKAQVSFYMRPGTDDLQITLRDCFLRIFCRPSTYTVNRVDGCPVIEVEYSGVSNISQHVSAHLIDRIGQQIPNGDLYERLEETGTDLLFAEGKGQVSCALHLMNALVQAKPNNCFRLIQPIPNKIELGKLFHEKCKGVYWEG